MFKIAIDSACDVPAKVITDEQIEILPLHITSHDQTINDLKDNSQVQSFYQQLATGTPATTSQINIGEFVTYFTAMAQQQQAVLYLGFSSGMSGTFNSAVTARELVLADYPDAEIALVDTLAACGGIGLMVEKACRLRKTGETLTTVQHWLIEHRLTFNHLFTLSDLGYLVRGGRLSKSSAMMGQLLHIQPILSINVAGKIEPLRKTRSMKKSLQSMVDEAIAGVSHDENAHFIIASSDQPAVATQLKQLVLNQLPSAQVELVPIGITLASHTGPNCTAIFFESTTPRG